MHRASHDHEELSSLSITQNVSSTEVDKPLFLGQEMKEGIFGNSIDGPLLCNIFWFLFFSLFFVRGSSRIVYAVLLLLCCHWFCLSSGWVVHRAKAIGRKA